MPFGLFRKKKYAESVITNGRIYTLDPDYPEAEALACAGGKIIAVGSREEIEEMAGPDTKVTDLGGRFAIPGLIELFAEPVENTLRDAFLPLSDKMSAEEVVKAVKVWLRNEPDADFCLALGASEEGCDVKESLSEEIPDKPVIVVCKDALLMTINRAAADIVEQRASDLGVITITPAFIIDSIVSADYDKAYSRLLASAEGLARRGCTSYYCRSDYSFMETIYKDLLLEMHQAGMSKQRYFGCFSIKRPLQPASIAYTMESKHTACLELDGYLENNTVEFVPSEDESSKSYMPEEYLSEAASVVADKGGNIRFRPEGKKTALACLDIAGNLSQSFRRQAFTVIHSEELTEEDLASIYTGDAFEFALKGERKYEPAKSEDRIYELTAKAAEILGQAGNMGTLSEGMYADLAVFDEDPMVSLPEEAYMTIVGGSVVYEKGKDSAAGWAAELIEALNNETEELFEP